MLEKYLKEFDKLNEYQKKAVMSKDRYVILNAVVGSGKTTVLTHKVLYTNYVYDISLQEMVVLTFTNKAASEIMDRVSGFDEGLLKKMKYFGTFHSVARKILSEHPGLFEMGYTRDFNVVDNEEAAKILTEIIDGKKLSIKYRSKLMKRVEEFKRGRLLYGVMKNEDDIGKLYDLYKSEKLNRGIMDFDDLIENCIRILDKPMNPKWIIVDEFQDTDERQLELITRIAGEETNIFVIGDPNQVIYSWRTGNSDIFEKFRCLYSCCEITLPINYRSTKTIIEAAKSFISGLQIQGIMGYGNPIVIKRHLDSFNEALHLSRRIMQLQKDGIPYRSIGILCRRQAQLEVVAEVFKRCEIPFKVVYKKPLPFEEDNDNTDSNEGVNLLTLHSSKGLEFSHVFIIGANMGNIPISTKRGEEEEEARLFFVGMTRAKNYLEISYVTKSGLPGVTSYPSPYISMISPNLVLREEEGCDSTLSNLMDMLRNEREKADYTRQAKRARHEKYGFGIIKYEDDVIVRVEFEGYGEKEFSKLFCPLDFGPFSEE